MNNHKLKILGSLHKKIIINNIMVIMNKNNMKNSILMKPHPTQDLTKVLLILRKKI